MYRGVITVLLLGLLALTAADADEASSDGGRRVAVGRTSQGRGMAIRVQPDSVKMLDFNARLRCRDGGTLIVEEGGFLPIDTHPNGAFRDVQHGNTDTVWLQGRVGPKLVSGRLRVTDRWGHVKCDSHWFRFTARFGSGTR